MRRLAALLALVACGGDGTNPSDASIDQDASTFVDAPEESAADASSLTPDAADANVPIQFDFYISTTGKDSNAGTLSAPWAITSLQDNNANNAKITGKHVGIIAGTYDVSGMTSGAHAGDYQFPILSIPAGSSTSPTIVGSSDLAGHDSPRSAIFDFAGTTSVNAVFGQDEGGNGYFTLDGVVLNGGGYNGSLVDFFGTSAEGITIQNCEIYGIWQATSVGTHTAGICLHRVETATDPNNQLHDIHKPAQPDHCHGYEEYSAVGTQFLYNTVMSCDTGLDGKVGSSGAIVAYNYFYNLPQGAVQGFDGAEGNPNTPNVVNTIHHNVIDSCGGQHVTDVNDTTSQALDWYNNTAYDTRTGSITTLDLRSSSNDLVRSYNNICVTTASSQGTYVGTIALSSNGYTALDYNDYFFHASTAGWGLSATTYDSLATWQTATAGDAHALTSDPKFTSTIAPGKGPMQFQLGAQSPCASAGHVGGISTGATTNIGAWDLGVTQIGASWVNYP